MFGVYGGTPLMRQTPWYPGQLGVRGSDNSLGLRDQPQAMVWYVDGGHPLADDNNDGTNPDEPLSTIAAAITKNNATIVWASTPPYIAQNWIIIAPGEYAENLAVPFYCKMVGLGMATGNTTDICVDVHPAAGSAMAGTGLATHLYNIRFTTDTAAPVLDFGVMNSCVVESCCITDGNPGLATVGIDTTGANSTHILNCRITGNSNGVTTGIRSTGDFFSCVVKDCQIEAVTTGIDLSAAALVGNTLIAHNYIHRPVTGINDGVGGTFVVDNWITAGTNAIVHAAAGTMCVANHVINNAAGAVELAATD